MELSTIRDAFDRVTKKQKLSHSTSQEIIDQVGYEIEHTLARLQSVPDPIPPSDQKSYLLELKSKLNAIGPQSQLEAKQKDLNINLSKYPKLLEKSFISDTSKAYRDVEFDCHTVNQIIASHFYQQGLFDLGDCLIHEAGQPEEATSKSQFLEIHQILEALKIKNLEPALKWVSRNQEKLKQIGSSLELKLHRLQFMEILQRGSRSDALNYARTYLAPFASLHMNEIQKLMACLLWARRLERSPYSEFIAPYHWEKLTEELSRLFCSLTGNLSESPLSVTVAAGIEGLPTLLKLANVMVTKRQEWQAMKQLPVPVDLGKKFQFHSVFVCPVSRDQASEENPPMLMPCGHVLCKQAVSKLSRSSIRPFKCPYCPTDASVSQCRRLFF